MVIAEGETLGICVEGDIGVLPRLIFEDFRRSTGCNIGEEKERSDNSCEKGGWGSHFHKLGLCRRFGP